MLHITNKSWQQKYDFHIPVMKLSSVIYISLILTGQSYHIQCYPGVMQELNRRHKQPVR